MRNWFKRLRWLLWGNTAWARVKRDADGNMTVEFQNFTKGAVDVHVTIIGYQS